MIQSNSHEGIWNTAVRYDCYCTIDAPRRIDHSPVEWKWTDLYRLPYGLTKTNNVQKSLWNYCTQGQSKFLWYECAGMLSFLWRLSIPYSPVARFGHRWALSNAWSISVFTRNCNDRRVRRYQPARTAPSRRCLFHTHFHREILPSLFTGESGARRLPQKCSGRGFSLTRINRGRQTSDYVTACCVRETCSQFCEKHISARKWRIGNQAPSTRL